MIVRRSPVPQREGLPDRAGPSLWPRKSFRTACELAATCESVRAPGGRASAFRTALDLWPLPTVGLCSSRAAVSTRPRDNERPAATGRFSFQAFWSGKLRGPDAVTQQADARLISSHMCSFKGSGASRRWKTNYSVSRSFSRSNSLASS